eukprot:GFYU01016715.1.p1 GENE.GFYU01016715.1~~GFYU01016715.1.p1  ORF type:complete len:368 (+),score=68.79 GFYU01016715.1:193-1296(+)
MTSVNAFVTPQRKSPRGRSKSLGKVLVPFYENEEYTKENLDPRFRTPQVHNFQPEGWDEFVDGGCLSATPAPKRKPRIRVKNVFSTPLQTLRDEDDEDKQTAEDAEIEGSSGSEHEIDDDIGSSASPASDISSRCSPVSEGRIDRLISYLPVEKVDGSLIDLQTSLVSVLTLEEESKLPDGVKAELEQLRQENEGLKEMIRDLRKSNSAARRELDGLRSYKERAKKKLAGVKNERIAMRGRVRAAEDKAANMVQVQQQLASLQEKCQKLEERNKALNQNARNCICGCGPGGPVNFTRNLPSRGGGGGNALTRRASDINVRAELSLPRVSMGLKDVGVAVGQRGSGMATVPVPPHTARASMPQTQFMR